MTRVEQFSMSAGFLVYNIQFGKTMACQVVEYTAREGQKADLSSLREAFRKKVPFEAIKKRDIPPGRDILSRYLQESSEDVKQPLPAVMDFGVDLVDASMGLLRILKEYDVLEWVRDEKLVKKAILKYEDFLQLCAEGNIGEGTVETTVGVQAIWISHAIRTCMYKTDCERLFHRFIKRIISSKTCTNIEALNNTSEAFVERFGYRFSASGEDKFHERARDYEDVPDRPIKINMKVSDVIEDLNWLKGMEDFQLHYQKQISISWFDWNVEEFSNWISLLQTYWETEILPASHRVDLVWHSFMLNSEVYEQFARKYFGKEGLEHFPWPEKDEVEEKKQVLRCQAVYRYAFGLEYQFRIPQSKLPNDES
jgi:hypothetical protein